MAGDTSSRPPQLSEHGEDFQVWKMRFKFFLLSQNKAAALVDERDPASAKVLGWIGTAVPGAFLLDIEACATAKAAWDRLQELFTEHTQADIYTLEAKYNDLALTPKETIGDYFNRASLLKSQLWTAGITIIVLPLYENLKTMCRVVTCNPMSAEEITAKQSATATETATA